MIDTHYGQLYSLHHPVTGELRYIGQTINSLQVRLGRHLKDRHGHKANWLKSLPSLPEIRFMAWAESKEELDLLEIQEIAAARAAGCRLLNISLGGASTGPHAHSPESREKISKGLTGKKRNLSEATRKAMSERMTASNLSRGPISGETRAKLVSASRGRVLPEEVREKIAAKATGRGHSEKTKKTMSDKAQGRVVSEETRAKMRVSQARRRRFEAEGS